jgi:hypothetical protein
MTSSELPAPMETYRRAEEAVYRWVRRARLEKAITFCERELSVLPYTAYHDAIGRSWLRQTETAARWLGDFFAQSKTRIPVRAIYCEMNRFEVNTDKWYLDGFAYDSIGDPDNLGWLCGWKHSTGDHSCLVLEGADDLKQAFWHDYVGTESPPAEINAPSELAILLLTLRMQELVHAGAELAWRKDLLPKDLPVFSAAHDSDLVCISATDIGFRRAKNAASLRSSCGRRNGSRSL